MRKHKRRVYNALLLNTSHAWYGLITLDMRLRPPYPRRGINWARLNARRA